ncbi:class A beta-lactamase-related serine hydrolase, partial [Flavobacteriaceae bacterium]|nr:class A beta-lactamase-related serine hydrolase [Flavobacteriaceae bacterium]
MKSLSKTKANTLKIIILSTVTMVLFSCGSHPKNYENALDFAISSPSKKIKRVMDNLEAHELQILFTTVERDKRDAIKFHEYSFQLDSLHYFYPASTVKFPIALLSLEKLSSLNRSHLDNYQVEEDSVTYSFANTINEIFAVSDNEANNRLFEFLGSDYINSKLK